VVGLAMLPLDEWIKEIHRISICLGLPFADVEGTSMYKRSSASSIRNNKKRF